MLSSTRSSDVQSFSGAAEIMQAYSSGTHWVTVQVYGYMTGLFES
jgi:hypothetical protein